MSKDDEEKKGELGQLVELFGKELDEMERLESVRRAVVSLLQQEWSLNDIFHVLSKEFPGKDILAVYEDGKLDAIIAQLLKEEFEKDHPPLPIEPFREAIDWLIAESKKLTEDEDSSSD